MTAGTFAGCGGRPAADADETGVPSGDETGAKTDGQKGEQGNSEGNLDNESTAMGRYVETVVDISESTSRSYSITALADERLVILDETAGQLIRGEQLYFQYGGCAGRDSGGALLGQRSVR